MGAHRSGELGHNRRSHTPGRVPSMPFNKGPGIRGIPPSSGGDRVWLTVRQSFLFLAPKSINWAPYAFVHLGSTALEHVDVETLTVTLTHCSSAKPSTERETPLGLAASDAG